MPTAPATYDPTAEINKLKETQRQAVIASLNNARQSALSSLAAEKSQIQPQYYNMRNQAAVGSQQQGRNFAEFMANRGLTNSGTNAQAEISRNVGLQGQIGNINQNEQNAYQDIARRETDAINKYNNDLASAEAGIESNALNQIIAAQQHNNDMAWNQYNADRGFAYQQNRDEVTDTRNDKLDKWNMDTVNNPALAGQILQNEYQKAVNAGYSKEEAVRIALIQAQISGQNLQNTNQDIINKYLPQQIQGQITGQNLQNTAQQITNKYLPQSLQAKANSSSGNLSSSDFGSMTPAQQKKAIEQQAYTEYGSALSQGVDAGAQYLREHKDALIQAIGQAGYNKLLADIQDRFKQIGTISANNSNISAAISGRPTNSPVMIAP
jgi:hypothetical protein